MEDQASVCTPCLVEAIKGISGAFIDSHHPDVRAAPQRAFHAGYRIVGLWVWTATPSLYIHRADLEAIQRSGDLTSAIDRHFFARDWIDTDLTAEKQEIATVGPQWEVEHPGVL